MLCVSSVDPVFLLCAKDRNALCILFYSLYCTFVRTFTTTDGDAGWIAGVAIGTGCCTTAGWITGWISTGCCTTAGRITGCITGAGGTWSNTGLAPEGPGSPCCTGGAAITKYIQILLSGWFAWFAQLKNIINRVKWMKCSS